jgi:hypothetical protein
VGREIVEHDEILGSERRGKTPFDIGQEFFPVMAPSMVCAARMPRRRSAATKVMVFQWPCGTCPTSRSPRAQRPYSRTILVLADVSSMNTNRAGSNLPCSRIHRRRARATSARSCSAARNARGAERTAIPRCDWVHGPRKPAPAAFLAMLGKPSKLTLPTLAFGAITFFMWTA